MFEGDRVSPLRYVVLPVALALLTSATASASRPRERAIGGSERYEQWENNKATPPLTAVAGDGLTRALNADSVSPAAYALERARSLFRLRSVRHRFGDVEPVPQEAVTSILRDLVLRLDELAPEDQATARRILARPDDPNGEPFGTPYTGGSETICSEASAPGFCIHWASGVSDPNRPPMTDANADGIPDWVSTTVAAFDEVWAQEITAYGFRPPKSDASSSNPGPDGRIDIYLANLGADRIYGYCTTDDPRALNQKLGTSQYPYYDVSAYCVLDNDFSETEFREGTPLSNLQVTAAHEFFHAIQSAYDYYEDWWMLEGTATAIEDLVFDEIDDNYQYLPASQFVRPEVPVDYSANDISDPSFLNRYGSWVFWRFLMEHLSSIPSQADPVILRKIWERSDASPEQRFGDVTSIKAVTGLVKSQGLDFPRTFGSFGASLYVPELAFQEASRYLAFLRANSFGRAPFARSKKLTQSSPAARVSTRVDHLAHKLYSFARGSGGLGASARLRVRVNGPVARTAPTVTLLVVRNDNTVAVKNVRLNDQGNGRFAVAFGDEVVRVVAIVTNASARFAGCNKDLFYSTSCGRPRDDDQRFVLKAAVL